MRGSSGRALAPLARGLVERWAGAPRAVALGALPAGAIVGGSAHARRAGTAADASSGASTSVAHARRATSSPPARSSPRDSSDASRPRPPSNAAEDEGDAIDVFPREGSGKIAVRHLRRGGMVPGIFFTSGATSGELISFASTDIERLVRRYGHAGVGSRVLELRFGGGARVEPVVAKQLMLSAETRAVENATFMPCGPDTDVRVRVPVRLEGEDSCPGIKRGGFAWKVAKTLEVRCKGRDIPPEIVVDVSKLELEDKVFLRDIALPGGVHVQMKDERIPIVKMAGKGR